MRLLFINLNCFMILFPAHGTELGVEVDNEIIELEIAPVVVEDSEEEKEDKTEEEAVTEETVVDDVNDDAMFDCPGPGHYASPTNCAQYYQCTAENKVKIIQKYLSYF